MGLVFIRRNPRTSTEADTDYQIKTLEQSLGQALFVRTPRRAQLTAHGEMLLSYARRLLALNAEAVARFVAPDVTGPVRLGLPDDLAGPALSQALGRLARRYPDGQVDVVAAGGRELTRRIGAGELDIALTTAGSDGNAVSPDCIVATQAMAWAGLPDGFAAARRPLPVALADQGCPWRSAAIDALDGAGIAYRLSYASESGSGQCAAAGADLAVAALPRALIRAPLVILNDLPAMAPVFIALIQRPDAGAAAATLADCLRTAFSSG